MKLFYTTLLVLLSSMARSQTNANVDDSLQLVSLFNSTGGPSWTNKTNWLSTAPLRTWYGVYVETSGRVSWLSLGENNLTGTVPPLNLPSLIALYLGHNNLMGSIPNLILPAVKYITLDVNHFTGNLPNFNFPNVELMYIGANQLSGSVPALSLPALKYFTINSNSFTGTFPNMDLPNLEYFNASNNQFSGSLPNFPYSKLAMLDFSVNHLTGSIPNFNLPLLQHLGLSNNQFSGSIPDFNLPSLKNLYLYVNQLTGSIPDFNLPQLENLVLQVNQLSGTLPAFSNLTSLKVLDIYYNRVTGSIPNFNLPTLVTLQLDVNQLSGELPALNLPNLKNFSASFNRLTGTIPNFNLPALENLVLESNQLTGSIPSFSFPNLLRLRLSNNHLAGTIPALNFPNLIQLALQSNSFTFDGMEAVAQQYPFATYHSQAIIPMTNANCTFSVNAGGTTAHNTYHWYRNNVLVDTKAGDPTFSSRLIGNYRVAVTNSVATALTLYSTAITLGNDANNDGYSDDCIIDADNDGILDVNDNCVTTYNPDQKDLDNDGIGDVCDNTTSITGASSSLVSQVSSIVTAGWKDGLIDKLNAAMLTCNTGGSKETINQLNAFINQVNAKRGKGLTDAQADQLIASANAMISAIQNGTAECGTAAFSNAKIKREQAEVLNHFQVLIHPNPTSSIFKIDFKNVLAGDKIQIRVMDVVGRMIENKQLNGGQTLTIGENYQPGVYYIETRHSGIKQVLKVVKM